MKKAVFLDRDGVINENVHDLVRPEQVALIPGAAEGIRKINESGFLVVVITNQPVIAKGFCTFEDVEMIHDRMRDLLAKEGARIDAVYVCPHHPEKGHPGEVLELKIDCPCRKPKPGLFLQAAKDLGIDLASSWAVGDSPSDVAAGKAAGTKTVYITSGGGSGSREEKRLSGIKADFTASDLPGAVKIILSRSSRV